MTSDREHSRLGACEGGTALALKVFNMAFTTVWFVGSNLYCVVNRRTARLVFVGLCRLAPKVWDAPKILQPENCYPHRAGFQTYWRCGVVKTRSRGFALTALCAHMHALVLGYLRDAQPPGWARLGGLIARRSRRLRPHSQNAEMKLRSLLRLSEDLLIV
jgi:hypothetical protein